MMWLPSAILSENVADVNLKLCTHWATKSGVIHNEGNKGLAGLKTPFITGW
jgi:hypothetical protein